ncbi:MAG: SfiI family type II restriction endonuclease [Betaproteobacteria bacterium]|nr:SfiI family type II restriction endonuclease [Betaproteobacteria bacterium]
MRRRGAVKNFPGNNLSLLEDIEKATLRLVFQAVADYRKQAMEIFRMESDAPMDIAEDITREALDGMGVAKMPVRLFGKVDYKRAQYVFLPGHSIKQALFVDSKAEHAKGRGTATLQMSQISMRVRQRRQGKKTDISGMLPLVVKRGGESFLTATVFVKYNYRENGERILEDITVACLPNGRLQEKYNPTVDDTIWLAGRDAPSLGEDFRVRLNFNKLMEKARWRVQTIPMQGEPLWTD